jgi:hypothetical protein
MTELLSKMSITVTLENKIKITVKCMNCQKFHDAKLIYRPLVKKQFCYFLFNN